MNPAERLLEIHSTLTQQAVDWTMLQIWAVVFGIKPEEPNCEDLVVACLVDLRNAIDFSRQRLDTYGVPANLTSPGFDRLKAVASTGQLNSKWHGHRGNVNTPDVRIVFEWAAWALRAENEEELTLEHRQQIADHIDALETVLRDPSLSPFLRTLTQRQVDTIRGALRAYRVQGGRALRDAVAKNYADIVLHEKELREEAEKESPETKSALSKLGKFVHDTGKMCDSLEKVERFGKAVFHLGEKVLPVLGM